MCVGLALEAVQAGGAGEAAVARPLAAGRPAPPPPRPRDTQPGLEAEALLEDHGAGSALELGRHGAETRRLLGGLCCNYNQV